MFKYFLVPVLMIVIGLVIYYNPDLGWERQKWKYKGEDVQPSEIFLKSESIGGIMLVIFGVALLIFGVVSQFVNIFDFTQNSRSKSSIYENYRPHEYTSSVDEEWAREIINSIRDEYGLEPVSDSDEVSQYIISY